MDSRHRKRKHHEKTQRSQAFAPRRAETTEDPPAIDPALYIQAHEADLVRGPQAWEAARSLEVRITEENGRRTVDPGSALIQWNPGTSQTLDWEEDEHMTLKGKRKEKDEEKQELRGVWVDRYDVRLLLDALPEIPPPSEASPPGSPTGWSDLPSDAEDTFFFSREEAEDYHREKRRRLIDQGREARLAALRAEAGDDADASPEDQWGGSDEEPDEPQRELMRRTAAHVLGSPNPAQLELRILANHGADPRFAFLRGRWSRAWRTAKGRVRLEKEQEAKERREQTTAQKPASALGGLTGYGDSDAEDSGEEGADPVPTQNSGEGGIEKADPAHSDVLSAGDMPAETESAEETIKKARRDRAREWAEKRRAAKIAAGDDSDI